MQEQKSNVGVLQCASFLTIALMGMGVTVVTPALATFAAHWEGADVSFIQTLTTLGCVAGSFIAGAVMGKKIKIRTLAILSSTLCLIFGVLPAFFDSYAGTLVCRMVYGLALGLLTPLGNTLIMQFYEGEKQASMLGFGTVAMSIGGIIFQTLGGVFAAQAWNLTFWGHILFVLAIIMSFFIPDEKKPTAEQLEMMKDAPKEKMNKRVWIPAVFLFLFNMVNMPMMMNASALFMARNAGGAVVVANALNGYTIAGIIAGLFFGKLFGPLKRMIIPLGFGIAAIGAAIIYLGQTAIVMSLGMVLIGFGFNMIMPGFMVLAGTITPPSTIGKASSLMIALVNLGGFMGSFWLILLANVFGENLMSALTTEIVIVLICAIILIFWNPFKQPEKQ